MLAGHGSVDLGGRQIGMSEQILHGSQVGTPLQEVGGETVSKGVRKGGDPLFDHSADPP
jgi:hypothetical protein